MPGKSETRREKRGEMTNVAFMNQYQRAHTPMAVPKLESIRRVSVCDTQPVTVEGVRTLL